MVMTQPDTHDGTDLEAVALLAEPLRRALYDYVAGSSEPVSRDEAAEAVGVDRWPRTTWIG